MSPFKKRALASAGLITGVVITAVAAGASGSPETSDKVVAQAAAHAVPITLGTTTTAPTADPAVPVTVPAAPNATSLATPTPEPVEVAPEPATEPEPVAAAPVPTGGGSVEDAIATFFPDVYESALGVARCESGLNPDATNGQFVGIFQIGEMHMDLAAELGYSWDQMYDPYVNAHVARALYDGSGWGPWSCRWAA